MNDAIHRMLAKYPKRQTGEYVQAIREILQELALLGLWRSKFFEKAAFYGGTALRILYGLDRFSEDLDFSLLKPNKDFQLSKYLSSLQSEIRSFGFEVEITGKEKKYSSLVQSAFLKTDTFKQLMIIEADLDLFKDFPKGQAIKIKIEVDTDPPPGFQTETKFLLQPIPFSVRAYALPDLFAGKMHALLCRKWKSRVKGRDWYDFVWYVANHPQLHLQHLEQRMKQSGHLDLDDHLTQEKFQKLLEEAIDRLNVEQAQREIEPFIKNLDSLQIWSTEFFLIIARRIILT